LVQNDFEPRRTSQAGQSKPKSDVGEKGTPVFAQSIGFRSVLFNTGSTKHVVELREF